MMDDTGSPSVINAALRELCGSAGLEGAAVVDCSDAQSGPVILYTVGIGGRAILADAAGLLRRATRGPSHAVTPDARPVLACPWILPPQRAGGLVLWRNAGAAAWKRSDHRFATAVAGLV